LDSVAGPDGRTRQRVKVHPAGGDRRVAFDGALSRFNGCIINGIVECSNLSPFAYIADAFVHEDSQIVPGNSVAKYRFCIARRRVSLIANAELFPGRADLRHASQT
jgi:hypothetical protein